MVLVQSLQWNLCLKDPPRKGQPLYNRHFSYLQQCASVCELIHFQLSKKGQPLYKANETATCIAPMCPLLRGSTVL